MYCIAIDAPRHARHGHSSFLFCTVSSIRWLTSIDNTRTKPRQTGDELTPSQTCAKDTFVSSPLRWFSLWMFSLFVRLVGEFLSLFSIWFDDLSCKFICSLLDILFVCSCSFFSLVSSRKIKAKVSLPFSDWTIANLFHGDDGWRRSMRCCVLTRSSLADGFSCS